MALRLGLIVNPVAGIGGPAALKGSDGKALDAADRGYTPNAPAKAVRFLRRLAQVARPQDVRIFAAPGVLGGQWCRDAGWKHGTLGPEMPLGDVFATAADDTISAAEECGPAEMDLVVFIGGDGTARDVAAGLGTQTPALGVPAGVKMFSECFAETPEAAAGLVADLARDHHPEQPLETQDADVLDLDEDAYRQGEMRVLHHARLRVPRSPRVQSSKCPACPSEGLEGAVAEIADRMAAAPEALYAIASGSTTKTLKDHLGVPATLIGVDVVTGDDAGAWRSVAVDADAQTLDRLSADAEQEGRHVVLVVSPIGGQGFVLGRGTGQISAALIQAALPDHVWVLATAGKLASIEDGTLHVDTGDAALDAAFPRYLRVVIGADRERMVRVAHDVTP